jgi:transcriptional regulator with XRE-family HTH domain
MNISDRTVSKWERGLGCPDVSLLQELSKVLGVNIEKILSGDLDPKDADRGNMKRMKFYICPTCGNILTSTGEAEPSCAEESFTH